MLSIGLLFMIMSPYTAFLPLAYMAYKMYENREAIIGSPSIIYNPWNIGLVFASLWALIVGIENSSFISVLASLAIPLYLVLSIYMQINFNTEERVEKLIKTIWALSFVPAALGIMEKLASYFMDLTWIAKINWSPTYIPAKAAWRIFSTFGNPNVAGSWFAAMTIISFYYLDKTKTRKRYLYGIATCLFVLCMILTDSRGAVLGLEFGFVVYALFKKNRGSIVALAFMIVVAVMMLFIPEISHPFNSREAIWNACMELFKAKPLAGWGLGGIYSNMGEVHAHNIWITILATLGLVGLGAYGFLKYHMYKDAYTLYKNGNALVPLLISIQALVVGHGIVDFIILQPQGGIMFFGSAAMINAMALQYNRAFVPEKILMPSSSKPVYADGEYVGIKGARLDV